MADEGVGRRNGGMVVYLGWLGDNQGSNLRKVCSRLRLLLGMGLGAGSGLAWVVVVGCWMPGPEGILWNLLFFGVTLWNTEAEMWRLMNGARRGIFVTVKVVSEG